MQSGFRFVVLTSLALGVAACKPQPKAGETQACADAREKLEASGIALIESGDELFKFKTAGPEHDAACAKRRAAHAAENAAHAAIAQYCPR